MNAAGSVLLGLIPLIWFGALHQALYDYWAMTLAFGWISALFILLIAAAHMEKRALKFPLLISWTLIVAAGWLSVIHSFDHRTSLWEAWGWTFCMFVFYIAVNGAALAPALKRLFLVSSGGVIALLSWAAVHEQLVGSPINYGALIIHGHSVLRYGHWEIHATLVNSIVFAGFLLSWSFTFWPLAPGRSRLNWIPFVMLLSGMLVSRSWAAWLCLAAGLASYHHRLYGKPASRAFLAKMLILACGVGALLVFWKMHQQTEWRGERYVPAMRILYWRAAMGMFFSRPWTGVGLGAYAVAFPYFKHAAGENTLLAHGLLWQILSETGMSGLLASGAFALEFLSQAKISFKDDRHSSEDLSLYIALITMLAFGMTTIYFDYLLNKLIFVIFAGFLCARIPTRNLWAPKISWVILGGALFITAASFWLNLFRAERYYVAGDYVQALRLNPTLADAWGKLADTEKDPVQAHRLRLTAWHWKKDRAYLSHL